MFRRFSFIIYLALAFLALSGIVYFVHFVIFRDVHHIFIYMVGDLAFLPLEVLLVVLIIERVLARREQQNKLQKLNMVVGAFFTEVGYHLLNTLFPYFDNKAEIAEQLDINADWTKKDFRRAAQYAYSLNVEIDCSQVDLETLKTFLASKRTFILTMLENPNLLEHDRFTDLLWAVTHLDEELEARRTLANLPDKDLEHLAGDIQRMYDHLASEWLDYVEHLKTNYPFLFSLILRTHPFQENPSPLVE
jgi:hypothetical protein